MKAIILLLTLTAAALAQPSTPIKDSRDGKTYRAVKIGKQVWMAENLGYAAEKSLCYDNDEENCEKYGRLYIWEAAMEACPSGWHLPDTTEWNKMLNYVTIGDKTKKHCKYLKAKSGWNNDRETGKSGNGNDKFGFKALPGGYSSNGKFYNSGNETVWWGSSNENAHYACEPFRYIFECISFFGGGVSCAPHPLFSVRCVRD